MADELVEMYLLNLVESLYAFNSPRGLVCPSCGHLQESIGVRMVDGVSSKPMVHEKTCAWEIARLYILHNHVER